MSVQPLPVTTSQVPSTAGRSASTTAWLYCWPPLVTGLLNWNGVGCILVLPFAQSRWYEAPSNPVLVNVQPATLYSGASLAGKQKASSPSAGCLLRPRPSLSPLGHTVTLPLGRTPNSVAGIFTGPVQFWKWPISLSKPTLNPCAAQVTRVFVDDVLYIGWKLYGMAWQDVPLGSNFTCANPLALLAVIDPLWPVVRSLMTTRRPFGVSPKETFRWSPGFMNRSLVGLGVNVPPIVDCSGFAGPVDLPFLVMKAKLRYSTPAFAWQVGLLSWLVTGFSERLSMFSAAHHLCGSQELAPTAFAQVGHWIQPGG